MESYFTSQRESIKHTMMKHEEIFKHQVHELHRLYKVQMTLMAELKSRDLKLQSFRNTSSGDIRDSRAVSGSTHSSYTSTRYPSMDQLSPGCSSLQLYGAKAGPNSQELSICPEDPWRIHKGYEDRARSGGIGTVAKNQTHILLKDLKQKKIAEGLESHTDGESDTELTLSIGCIANKKKPTHIGNDLGCAIPTISETSQLISTSPVGLEAREEHCSPTESFSGQRLQGPPWLLKSLNLNRT